jgi:nucleoid-associated protein YgaU
MTSDAKIGLLLGLVFIFIIAFVINGLPRFRNPTNGSEMTTNMVSLQNDTQPIGSRERNVTGALNWTEQNTEQTFQETQAPVEPKENVRFKMQLPNDVQPAKDDSVTAVAEEAEPTVPAEVEPAPQVQTPEQPIEAEKPMPAKSIWPKFYVVAEDDYLGLVSVAKKLYGAEQGNKKINIDRIFEANRNILKSPDEIYVGQKLTIPSPAASEPQTNTKETSSSFADSLFEKVKSIGRKQLSTSPDKEKPSAPYVVRDGDNLWRIAAEQLGNGGRFKEISQLNANIIKDENDLEVGMLLRIPAR